MLKKYAIRLVGALCILGALALIFLPGCIVMDGVRSRALREVRDYVSGITSEAKDRFLSYIEWEESFQDELEDYDLPHTRSRIKSRFKEIDKLTDVVLKDTYSLTDVLTLTMQASGLIEDMQNILDSNMISGTFFRSAADYVVQQASDLGEITYDTDTVYATAEMYQEAAEDSIDVLCEISFVFTIVTWALIGFAVLGVASAITHMFNKGRWVKYLFLVLLVSLVVGLCVAVPMVSEIIADSMVDVPDLEDLSLKVTVTPFIAVVLTIIPVVLDIVFERKQRKKVED